ncbi:hypothetical protein OUZ56_010834 [Daphnia magna]|uniref:Uncharacterized protein n=1 Tax=Daphnia magna TaxID=35525 RepID=A0ABQ9YYT3_9CRUS|nr:hypothetical protein OUZ56_010834 [Daphnia magna]
MHADRRHQAGKSANDAVLTGSMGLGRRIITAAMGLVSRRTCALQVRLAAACPTQALLGLQCVLECKLPKWWPACSGRPSHPLLTGKRVAGEPSQGGL